LHRLPYFRAPTTVSVAGDSVRVRPFQIIVWVSIGLRPGRTWNPRTPRFPAILDPGNNHNFLIFTTQLMHWAGIRPVLLPLLGAVRERGRRMPLRAATLWLHRNVPGTREPSTASPHPLDLTDGIAVDQHEGVSAPHLPLLGLRALTHNRLYTVIDGDRLQVSICTRRRWWWPFT
jgi:hypothetical protein